MVLTLICNSRCAARAASQTRRDAELAPLSLRLLTPPRICDLIGCVGQKWDLEYSSV